MSKELFDPLVAEWFSTRFGTPTEPQILGWPEIRSGHDVLISAPTGSGKTLAAFLICLDRLVRAARAGELSNETEVVYVSPLKALSNDVHKNLEVPLAEIAELAARRGIPLAPIRTAVRTGDTPASERQQMGKHRPHILVTTPESLYILLTAEKSREMLKTTRTVIVDEIHAVADDKRGSHLALSLARLDALCDTKPQRIGLSATVKPIEEVAEFLSPQARIVNIGHRREMELAVEVPRDELGPVASNEMWAEIYDRLAELILTHRTTLVFVNTRRLSERVAHALAERLGENVVLPHHGSLSRALRLNAEARLKSGELRAVVATASLELGIDIGTVDLVCQIGSPRSIAVALQRVGRSGHWVGAKPQGPFLRDHARRTDRMRGAGARHPLRAIGPARNSESAARYSGAADRGRDRRARLAGRRSLRAGAQHLSLSRSGSQTFRCHHRNAVRRHRDAARTQRRVPASRSGERPRARPPGRAAGRHHLRRRDSGYRELLGGRRAGRQGRRHGRRRFRGREPGGRCLSAGHRLLAHQARGTGPRARGRCAWRAAVDSVLEWRSAGPDVRAVGSRRKCAGRDRRARPIAPMQFLMEDCGLDEGGAKQAVAYVLAGAASLGALPTQKTVVAERFFDEGGGMQLVIHAPFGSRINRAWGLALRKRFCRSFNFELQAAATDNGIIISLTEQHAFPLELVFEFLKPQTVEHVLTQAMLDAPMFTARWRWNASRALAIPRFRGGRKVPPPIQRMRADDLLASVFPDQVACAENLTGEIRIPDHPLVEETIDNCLHEAMDLDGLTRLLEDMESGAIRKVAIDNAEPSPFSHEILNANPYAYLDDAPLEERRARAVQLRRTLRTDVSGGAGILDPAAIATVAAESWPDVRDADELHDALLSLITLPPSG